ncbi:hypothetical protein [Inconstantimicrobium mannanitabidum]|uniref:Uncharacterized protein n=1 Tax=Inconstantimicrobium mannanitabidum TaxID=1604901 RepID=A0ACB5R9H6_9CLOT|nr:hypothetical protein [Clostridium sp. TW13]GKX65611.1 hypothetical protein rsdtw13_08690 [Clostridium sp. TW13]
MDKYKLFAIGGLAAMAVIAWTPFAAAVAGIASVAIVLTDENKKNK